MGRFFLFAALMMSSLFMAFVALIRSQPYNDSNIRDFLRYLNDCPPPCWQDVRPGVTTTTSAVNLLEAHAWVNEVDEHIWFSTPGSSLFSWTWSGQQPAWIEGKAPGVLVTRLNLIESIKISTRISLADLWLALPEAKREIAVEPIAGTAGSYVVRYPAYGFEAHIALVCPFHLRDFWQSRTELYFVEYEEVAGSQDSPITCRSA